MKGSFDSQATRVMFGLFFLHYPLCLYNQAPADVRLTGAGIKCLYCSSTRVKNPVYPPHTQMVGCC